LSGSRKRATTFPTAREWRRRFRIIRVIGSVAGGVAPAREKRHEGRRCRRHDGSGTRRRPLQAAFGRRHRLLAMLLAITGLGGQNATKDALNSNIMASND
jgi:hypothetical protein